MAKLISLMRCMYYYITRTRILLFPTMSIFLSVM